MRFHEFADAIAIIQKYGQSNKITCGLKIRADRSMELRKINFKQYTYVHLPFLVKDELYLFKSTLPSNASIFVLLYRE